MQFQKGHLFHIYNQGNNRQTIFFEKKNYLFFIEKMRTYILPYADIISWCLMPNHFHIMVYVREESISVSSQENTISNISKKRTFNESIGILLRSYTRAINKQEDRTGALFREKTKAECVSCNDGITPSFFNTNFGVEINIKDTSKQYPQICFEYIHNNPVKASLASKPKDWEFSSAKDYLGLRSGTLINKTLAKEYVDF